MSCESASKAAAPAADASLITAPYLDRLNVALNAILPAADEDPSQLHQAMRYATDGGKRLRALLVYCGGEALGKAPELFDAPACAVELIHAYSLVHDDLPAMDNDDLRRGRPTLHKAYDEATAILAGDALLTLAFRILAHPTPLRAVKPEQQLALCAILAEAAGSLGMVGGQVVDMESAGRQLSLERLRSLHARKTGALILACLRMAAVTAGADAVQTRAFSDFGSALGLAFQIQDDLLDESSSTQILGKTQGKDRAQGKSTYPALLGYAAAKTLASTTFGKAHAALAPLGESAARLHWITDLIESRDH